jgi:hypothetical protein
MKTKIIYISGSEIFDIADIRGAFEEVRGALNLGKDTVLFGVPVDAEDAGFATKTEAKVENIPESAPIEIESEPVVTAEIVEEITEIIPTPLATEEEKIESVEAPKKRGRPRKEAKTEEETDEEPEIIVDASQDTTITESEDEVEEVADEEEKVVPILSVLATQDTETTDTEPQDIEIIPEISDEVPQTTEEEPVATDEVQEEVDEDEAGLEKLLSAMTPLEEDVLDEDFPKQNKSEPEVDPLDISVDATLEQLATEFIENQDKIATETKSNSRSKIGKLRNILPFKQSKHKDQGLGDLFGWAGIAANDEDFSVPGFFTSAASKK